MIYRFLCYEIGIFCSKKDDDTNRRFYQYKSSLLFILSIMLTIFLILLKIDNRFKKIHNILPFIFSFISNFFKKFFLYDSNNLYRCFNFFFLIHIKILFHTNKSINLKKNITFFHPNKIFSCILNMKLFGLFSSLVWFFYFITTYTITKYFININN